MEIKLQALSAAPPIIYWNTTPDTSQDGRKIDWTSNDWIAWHKKIAAKYGTQRANEVTQQWWDRMPWYDTRTTTWWFNCAFYNYFRKAGGGWASLIPSVVCTIDESGGKVIEKIGKTAENVADSAERTSKVASWIASALITAGALGVGVYIYKNYLADEKRKSLNGDDQQPAPSNLEVDTRNFNSIKNVN